MLVINQFTRKITNLKTGVTWRGFGQLEDLDFEDDVSAKQPLIKTNMLRSREDGIKSE